MHLGRIQGQEGGIERVAFDRPLENRRIRVARDAHESRQSLFLRFMHHTQRAGRREQNLELLREADVVKLEEIDVVGLQPLERLLELAPGIAIATLVGLRRHEHLVPAMRKHLPVVQLRVLVYGRGIEVVDSDIDRPIDDLDGLGRPLVESGFSAETEYRSTKARPAQRSIFHPRGSDP